MWQSRFNGDTGIVGRILVLEIDLHELAAGEERQEPAVRRPEGKHSALGAGNGVSGQVADRARPEADLVVRALDGERDRTAVRRQREGGAIDGRGLELDLLRRQQE